MLNILIYLTLGLIVVALLMMLAFGAKNAAWRLKGQGPLALFAFVLPVLVFVVAYAVNASADDGLALAAVTTAMVLIASGMLALVVAGVRGLTK